MTFKKLYISFIFTKSNSHTYIIILGIDKNLFFGKCSCRKLTKVGKTIINIETVRRRPIINICHLYYLGEILITNNLTYLYCNCMRWPTSKQKQMGGYLFCFTNTVTFIIWECFSIVSFVNWKIYLPIEFFVFFHCHSFKSKGYMFTKISFIDWNIPWNISWNISQK